MKNRRLLVMTLAVCLFLSSGLAPEAQAQSGERKSKTNYTKLALVMFVGTLLAAGFVVSAVSGGRSGVKTREIKGRVGKLAPIQ